MAFPEPSEIVSLVLEVIGRGVPRERELHQSGLSVKSWVAAKSDEIVPCTWTSGSVKWHDLLARAHSYREIIMLYEARVLLRSIEIVVKLPFTRRSYLAGLEDNQAVCGAWAAGRSSRWAVNQVLRRRTALEVAGDVCAAAAWVGTLRMPLDRLSRERVVRRSPT